jgi:hypothetical protein
MPNKSAAQMRSASEVPASEEYPRSESTKLHMPESVKPSELEPSSRKSLRGSLAEPLADGRDSLTAAWAAAVRTAGSDLPPHLIPARTYGPEESTEELPRVRGVRSGLFLQMWRLWRGECCIFIASVLAGIAVTRMIFGK